MNSIVIVGNLTKDPDLNYTQSGLAVCNFAVAVNRPVKDEQTGQNQVDFINCVAWRQRAEFLAEYGSKGRKVAVQGRLQIRSYDGSDGVRRTVAEIQADNVELVGPNPNGASTNGAPKPQDQGDADSFADPFTE